MTTETKILERIYLNPGIHTRQLSRELKLGMPSVKYGLNKLVLKELVFSRREGRNVKFYVNYRNNLIIPSLCSIEYSRLLRLPRAVQNTLFDLLKLLAAKPVLALIFGSYAQGTYTARSDLDVLLVFNQVGDDVERKAAIVSGRYGLRLEPIYLSWSEFAKKFFDEKDAFMRKVKENKILVAGIEWWVMLEHEKA